MADSIFAINSAAGTSSTSANLSLAAHLLSRPSLAAHAALADSALGRVDLLFELLKRLEILTPDQLKPYIDAVHHDTERRPIAEQIIDRLLAEDESRYKVYEELRAARPLSERVEETVEASTAELHEAIGHLLSKWARLERVLRDFYAGTDQITATGVGGATLSSSVHWHAVTPPSYQYYCGNPITGCTGNLNLGGRTGVDQIQLPIQAGTIDGGATPLSRRQDRGREHDRCGAFGPSEEGFRCARAESHGCTPGTGTHEEVGRALRPPGVVRLGACRWRIFCMFLSVSYGSIVVRPNHAPVRNAAVMRESNVHVAYEANVGMTGNRMSWSHLLDDTRIRKALEGKDSVKAEAEARSEFERDRDRTIYSNPVRRLIQKTQVFPLDPNDHVRTRLVHSLEVSTVAEGLSSQVVREVINKRETLTEEQRRAIPKIAETCGLLHDLGNPPFGHAGELAIASWFEGKHKHDVAVENEAERFFLPLGGPDSQKAQDFLRFEGNAQTMRIVTNTHLLGHDQGLNLTCATTAAARKYLASSLSADREGLDHAYAKPGYFFSEAEIFSLVSKRTGTQGRRHPITFLVEAADDMVYSVVDIEDGVKKRILTWRQVREFLAERCGGFKLYAQAIERTEKQLGSDYKSDRAFAQAFRVNAISELVLAVVRLFGHRYDEIMEGHYKGELICDPGYDGAALVKACKDLLRETVFRQEDVLRLEIRGRRVLHDLMDLFWEGVSEFLQTRTIGTSSYGGKLYLIIAESYRALFEKRLAAAEDGMYLGLQLVTDYVSGMTDRYACRLHEELVNG